MVGHMKTNGSLSRCALRGMLNAVRCGSGHNIRKTLAHLSALWAEILAILMAAFNTSDTAKGSRYGVRALAT